MRTKSINMVWIVVKDFKRAIKFYSESVGLKVVEINEEWGWAELEGHEGEGMRLGIAQQNAECPDPVQPGNNYVVTFTVENLDQANKDLVKQGVKLVGEVHEVPGHVRMQGAKDADGNFFQVVQVLTAKHDSMHDKKTGCCSH